jgi:exopolysaccharide production protein ExoQ
VRYGIGFITQINQAHNGYLDLLLAVGVAGLVAYVGVVIGFIHCLSVAEHQSQNRTLALCWVFFIFSLLHNITESTLLRGYSPVWVMQLIAMAITYRMAHEAKGSR